MSSRTNRRPAILVGLILLLGVAGPASAAEIRLWPLFDFERSAESSRLRVLGPLFEWRREPERSRWTLRPLLHLERRTRQEISSGALLYPLAAWERRHETFSLRVLGLASYTRSERSTATSPWTRELTVYPLVFYRESPATGRSLSVIPFHADLTGFLGYERIRMFLFPLYLKLEEPLHERTWLPFPFVSTVGGRLGSGFRLWPLYGRTAIGRESETRYVLWPFWIRHVDHPHTGPTTTRIAWPFFSLATGPRFHSRTWGYLLVLPLYTRTVSLSEGTETLGFPWPFWTTQRSIDDGELRAIRLTPFWQDRRTPALRSVFVLWPFWRWRSGLGDDAAYERTDVLFFVWRDQTEGDGSRRRRLRVLFPLWRSDRPSGDGEAQALTLLDGIFPANEPIRELWAPLWRFYGARRHEGRTDHEILWGLLGWGDDRLRAPLSLSRD